MYCVLLGTHYRVNKDCSRRAWCGGGGGGMGDVRALVAAGWRDPISELRHGSDDSTMAWKGREQEVLLSVDANALQPAREG
ncbi:hypothetical protein DHEL01_v201210 [Diaporthe helianthi]|uniref:Uncharacterized protein n=1 Tax=Diaporthe helianthi TaxID=158607 RepID=A0A2P5ID17_DIAHE|nr:hypothetical protein DHEL01_v201210 [Diaporthe helianthi]